MVNAGINKYEKRSLFVQSRSQRDSSYLRITSEHWLPGSCNLSSPGLLSHQCFVMMDVEVAITEFHTSS